ncbi:MAG: hypothetical protein ABSF27_05385 [Candidatus Dormibacteria bacterium]
MSRRLPLPQRLALALYPPGFRGRYGEELRWLVEDSVPSLGMVWDLTHGAARAWLRLHSPGIPGQRRR